MLGSSVVKLDLSGVSFYPDKLEIEPPEYNFGSDILTVEWTMYANGKATTPQDPSGAFHVDIHSGKLGPDVTSDTDPDLIDSSKVASYAKTADAERNVKQCTITSLDGGQYRAVLPLDDTLVEGPYTVRVGYSSLGAYMFSQNYFESEDLSTDGAVDPGVDSETGIPSVGEDATPEQVLEAVEEFQDMTAEEYEDLFTQLETAMAGGVSASSGESSGSTETKPTEAELEKAEKVLEQLTALDQAAQNAGITVNYVVASDAPAGTKASDFTIVGAALNAEDKTSTHVDFQIAGAVREHTPSTGYDQNNYVAYNLTLLNVADAANLKVPVVVTMKVPSSISAKKAVVLHYHAGSSKPTVIRPSVSDDKITFVLKGFSDFLITEFTGSSNRNSVSTGRASAGNGSVVVGGGSGGITVTPTTPSGVFTDVPYSHTFATQIQWAKDNGIMGGYADGGYHPDAYTTRQVLWMVLARLAGANPTDMNAAREWAVANDISDGTNPGGTLSRQQLITMLYRVEAASGTPTGSADLSACADGSMVADYAKEAMAWGVANGIITGTSDGKLNPENPATRAHFAAFLYRYANLPATAPAATPAPAEDTADVTDEELTEALGELEEALDELENALNELEGADDGVGPDET